jgi:hypothetical protein
MERRRHRPVAACLTVVIWIGGVAMVTMVVLLAITPTVGGMGR